MDNVIKKANENILRVLCNEVYIEAHAKGYVKEFAEAYVKAYVEVYTKGDVEEFAKGYAKEKGYPEEVADAYVEERAKKYAKEYAEGYVEGIQEGIAIGKQNRDKGISIESISELTGLPSEKVRNILKINEKKVTTMSVFPPAPSGENLT